MFVLGNNYEELLTRPKLAVVGSRKVTPYGRGVTEMLVTALVAKGVVIVSGLALGVDSIAHQACLSAGGQTIAVLPSSLNRIYPRTHHNLAQQILRQGGALVTEYETDESPFKHYFIARNRIIAGLGDGILLTEAAERSGSLHTANFGLELGKQVMAVPGNITSQLSAGCNNLIKYGAVPVMSVDDILAAMDWTSLREAPKQIVTENDQERRIIELLQQGVSDGADLLKQSKLEASLFNQNLTMLEITGRIRPTGANHWSL